MVCTNSGIIPITTGLTLEVLRPISTCIQGNAIVLEIFKKHMYNVIICIYVSQIKLRR